MTDETSTLSRNYRQHKIEFSPADLKFHVTGPEFEKLKETCCIFPSFDEAKISIDKAADAKNFKFNATVIDEDGSQQTITGISRTTGSIVGATGRSVYPNLDWIATDLQRRTQIQEEMNQIDKKLHGLDVSIQRAYGRIDADEYPRKLDALTISLNEKLELAKTREASQTPIIEGDSEFQVA